MASSGVTREQVLLQVRWGGVMSGIFDFLVNVFLVVFCGNPYSGARGFN